MWLFLTWFKIISLPGPIDVIKSFFSLIFFKEPVTNLTLIEHAAASLVRILIGTAIAFALAVPLGILMGWYKIFDFFFEPITELLRPISPLAWIPIAIIVFGAKGPLFIIFIGVFFPVLLNTIQGVSSVDKKLIDMSKIFRATEKQLILKIIIPSSLPYILTGMRIGVGIGWMVLIAAEMITLSSAGLGYFLMTMYAMGYLNKMVACMMMIGIIGYSISKLLLKLEKTVRY